MVTEDREMLSEEHILSYIPTYDLVLSVSRVCRKFQALCQDKSLISHVRLQKEYRVSDEALRKVLKDLSGDVQTLEASGCYWLAGSTLDVVTRCVGLVRLDVSGWRVTAARLSRLLGSLRLLCSLALDIGTGFDLQQLSGEGKAALSRLSELKQTLLTPSYGVVPCCGALQSLSLHLEVGWHEPSAHLQLMVGQSSVPRYHNLHWFSARLAPGEVNRALLSLFLAVFSMRVPEGLTGLVVAMPGPGWCHVEVGFGIRMSGLLEHVALRGATGAIQQSGSGCENENGALKQEREGEAESFLHPLITGCSYLVELELIGMGFLSAMPRYEPAMRKDPATCSWSFQVRDEQLAALG
ncbi:hypothetical protein HF521_013143, partial [Silurus meridionalis]